MKTSWCHICHDSCLALW